ncbi:hypothetical protein EII12_08370 [Buchananella hordeovulneris]|uniref:hypothetical protein n=1 Tax=Buchananella hordeovulneris TaxID=52770 RepID=UPI000F5D5FAA|nr:hypothetical protein [Buchananella hordeovulneris]RRD51287.1 hypothetical protein EII12_08370 [Buchananella hordeovulneris]
MQTAHLTTADTRLAATVQDLAELAGCQLTVTPGPGAASWLTTPRGRVRLATAATDTQASLLLPGDADTLVALLRGAARPQPVVLLRGLGPGWAALRPSLQLAAARGACLLDARAAGFVPAPGLAWGDIAAGARHLRGAALRAGLGSLRGVGYLAGDARGGPPQTAVVAAAVRALAETAPVFVVADDDALAPHIDLTWGWDPGGPGALARALALARLPRPLIFAVACRDRRWRRAVAAQVAAERADRTAPVRVVGWQRPRTLLRVLREVEATCWADT